MSLISLHRISMGRTMHLNDSQFFHYDYDYLFWTWYFK